MKTRSVWIVWCTPTQYSEKYIEGVCDTNIVAEKLLDSLVKLRDEGKRSSRETYDIQEVNLLEE